jgi:ferric-dicitrate binding protein FerR (iron transport regulator)
MDESFIKDCLNKDAEAKAYWKAFEQAHPEYLEVLEEARRCVSAMYAWGQSTEIEEQWDKLQEMIGGKKDGLKAQASEMGLRAVLPADEPVDPRRTSRFRRLAWGIGAAAVTAGVLICTGLWTNKGKQPLTPISYISLSAPAGIVRECGLPDGSTVWLDAGSSIRYRNDPSGSRGIVLVEGQIFCRIKHDGAHPFSVHTPAGLEIKDIGTAFSVQSYKGLNREVVKVAEGEVAVQKADNNLQLLKENQGVGLDVQKGELTRTENPAGGDTSWISGRIELNDVTFGELAVVLEKTFDVHISFENPDLMKCRASSSFHRTDPVRDVLDALKLIYGVTYTMKGQSLVLHGGPGHL